LTIYQREERRTRRYFRHYILTRQTAPQQNLDNAPQQYVQAPPPISPKALQKASAFKGSAAECVPLCRSNSSLQPRRIHGGFLVAHPRIENAQWVALRLMRSLLCSMTIEIFYLPIFSAKESIALSKCRSGCVSFSQNALCCRIAALICRRSARRRQRQRRFLDCATQPLRSLSGVVLYGRCASLALAGALGCCDKNAH
jgi:hypothetical protein